MLEANADVHAPKLMALPQWAQTRVMVAVQSVQQKLTNKEAAGRDVEDDLDGREAAYVSSRLYRLLGDA